ncbi:MAG: Hpt domain-containing protein, partial [Planctomycetota bacterium]
RVKDLLDLAVMREMAAGCGWRLDELVERYLREAHSELGKLKNAASIAESKRVAHGLKGASATAGVVGMTEVMRRIEDNELQEAVATDSTGA